MQVVDVYFPKHPVTHQRQAFCFVTFSTKQVSAFTSAVLSARSKQKGQKYVARAGC